MGRQENREQGSARMESAMHRTQEQASEIAEKARQQAQQAGEQVKEQVKGTTEQAQQQIKSMLDTRKGQAAGQLGQVAQAFREVSHQMRGQEQSGQVAGYAEQIAGQIDRASRYLSQNDVDRMVRDVQQFAQRQPEVFLGGALALGVMLGRFLRTTTPEPNRPYDYSYGYPQPSRYRNEPEGSAPEFDPNRRYDDGARFSTGSWSPSPTSPSHSPGGE